MKPKLSIPKRMELSFDGAYLAAATALGLGLLLGEGHALRSLWGMMALLLAAGDAFHLIPRMRAALADDPQRFRRAMGLGKGVTSLTMTGFYLLLWQGGLQLFALTLPAQTAVLYGLAGVRVILCLLPQNHWQQGGIGGAISLWRNVPFALMGLMTIWMYAVQESRMAGLVSLAVALSFACYLPVVLWVERRPQLGMLMLPKTCAYLWIIALGYRI